MAFLKPHRLPVRFIPTRFFIPYSIPSLHHFSSLSSPLSRSTLLSTTRTKFQLTRGLNFNLIHHAVLPRFFMASSSLAAAEAFQEETSSKAYGSEQIQVLEGLDPVRKRPGMYIGSTGLRGLHHLIYKILDNAIDEVQEGFASNVDIVLLPDNSVSISDNGRGIPTDMHPDTKKSSLETVSTVLHARGKFDGSCNGYSFLGGVGISVVNAFSEALEITVWRDGMEFQQKYSRGKPMTTRMSQVLPDELSARQGTHIRFWPDTKVFTTSIEFDCSTIDVRLRELAFVNPKVTITLRKEDVNPEKTQHKEYYFASGLLEYVKWLNANHTPLHEAFGFTKEVERMTVDVALQWCSDAYSDTMIGYANGIKTVDGGTHIDGMKASLTKILNNLAKKSKIIKERDISLSGEHVREGLACVISVKVPYPEFEGQTRTRLGNPGVREVVDQSVQEYLTEYLELHPDVLDLILSKSLTAHKTVLATERLKRARELVRQKSLLKSSSLPGN